MTRFTRSLIVVATFGLSAGVSRAAQPPVTFTKAIAPILTKHCVPCHQPGGHAPFSLLDYDAARMRAALIASVTSRRVMPPWKPDAPLGAFQGERRLTGAEIELIGRWAAAGAPEGPRASRPAATATPHSHWQLGPPDLVLTMPEPYVLAPGQNDIFRKFVLPVPLRELRWIRAIEIQPGPSHAIHHARIMIDATGHARDLDTADPQPGYDGFMIDSGEFPRGHVLGWAPGKTPTALPDKLSWPLAPGTDLVLQLHMLPRADAVEVLPEVGLYFATAPATLTPMAMVLNSMTIDIPAGDAAHIVRDDFRLPVAVDLLAIYPHAHYLAREIQATATLPDGTDRTLIRIGNWDYNWQDEYRYVQPVHLPAGTRIEMRYVYDNSAANPRNRSTPPQPVRFGPKATDEMAQLMLQVLTARPEDSDVLAKSLRAKEAQDEVLAHQARLRRDPNDYKSRTKLAVKHLEAGQVDAALEELREAIRLAPEYPDAHYNLGSALLARGAVRQAIAAYRRATELDPDYAEAHNNLGVLLESLGDRAGAVEHYTRAIQVQPHQAGAHYNLANALLAEGKPGEALAHYRETLASDPAHAEAHARLGLALTQLKRRTEALAAYRRALALDPNLGNALVGLAWLLATAPESNVRNAAEAIALARRAMAIVGADRPDVLDTLAAAYASEGRFDQAIETAQQAASRAAASPEFTSRTAQIEQRRRLYESRRPYRMPE